MSSETSNFTVAEYSPNAVVRALHGYPHVGDEDEFSSDLDGAYWTGIKVMFIATAFVGFLCILIQCFFFCFESCCACCSKRLRCSSLALRVILFFLFAWLLVGTGLTYYGRNEFHKGADKVHRLSLELEAVFSALAVHAADLNKDAEALTNAPDPCSGSSSSSAAWAEAWAAMERGTAMLHDTAADLVGLLTGLDGRLGDVGVLFDTTIPAYIDWGIGLVTGFIALTVFFGLASVCCGDLTKRQLLIGFTVVVLVLLCPLVAFELSLSVVLSDFCVALSQATPDGTAGSSSSSFLEMAQAYAPASTLPLITFYATCNGTNPLVLDLDAASDALSLLNQSAQALKQAPDCDVNRLGDLQRTYGSAGGSVGSMGTSVECEDINPFITEMLHEVLCQPLVAGVYKIWVVQLACALSLYFLLFLVQAEIMTRQQEGRLELALQEQRLRLKPSDFKPKKGTAARRKYDRTTRQQRDAADAALAAELDATAAARAKEEAAWAAADAEAVAEAAEEEKLQWLVKPAKGFGGSGGGGEARREAMLRVGPGSATAAAAMAAALQRRRSARDVTTTTGGGGGCGGGGLDGGGGGGTRRGGRSRAAKRVYDPDGVTAAANSAGPGGGGGGAPTKIKAA